MGFLKKIVGVAGFALMSASISPCASPYSVARKLAEYRMVDGKCVEVEEEKKPVVVPPEYSKNVIAITRDDKSVFLDDDVKRLYSDHVSADYVKALSSLRDKDGYMSTSDIIDLSKADADPDYVRAMTLLTDFKNKKVFTASNIKDFRSARGDPHLASDLLSIPDDSGASLFKAQDIIDLNQAGGDLDYAKKWAERRYKKGGRIYTGHDIAGAKMTGLDQDDAVPFENNGFSGTEVYRFNQLGLSLEDVLRFHDTDKPNALVVYHNHHVVLA